MITIVMYMDGARSQCGYRFTIQRDGSSWVAFHTVPGLRYFMDSLGLRIDPSTTRLNDLRDVGRGRNIVARFHEKFAEEVLFWEIDEVPAGAKPFIRLCNGEYVPCYVVDEGDRVTVYKPNPNCRFYQPLDYFEAAKLYD